MNDYYIVGVWAADLKLQVKMQSERLGFGILEHWRKINAGYHKQDLSRIKKESFFCKIFSKWTSPSGT